MNKEDTAIVNLNLMDASAEFIARCYYSAKTKREIENDMTCEVCPPKIANK